MGQLSTEWLLTARVDQNIGNNDRLFGHFRTNHGFQATVTDAISPVYNLAQFFNIFNHPHFDQPDADVCVTNLRADHQTR